MQSIRAPTRPRRLSFDDAFAGDGMKITNPINDSDRDSVVSVASASQDSDKEYQPAAHAAVDSEMQDTDQAAQEAIDEPQCGQ
eukprot:SAG22_NODE_17859_length_297_cov_1.040404_1_plen_82_part_10